MTSEEIRAAIERLRAGRDYMWTAEIFNTLIGEDVTSGRTAKFIDALIDLLQQADPDTHMELPVGADGVPIHIGDELVSNHSKEKFVVTRLQYSRKHAWMVGGADKDDLSKYSLYAPCETRHYHKPTVEDVLRDFVNRVMRYNEDEDDGDAIISDCANKLRKLMADDDAR